MPNEMVERVARAMWLARYRLPAEHWDVHWQVYAEHAADPDSWVHQDTVSQTVRDARAAIEAMLEPTARMREVGEEWLGPDFVDCWQTAIDAALSEEEGGDG